MAIKKAEIVTVTSVKGGTGKTITTLNIAGTLAKMGHNVLVIDMDFYAGGVAATLNADPEKDIYLMVNDFVNNRFDSLDNYTQNVSKNIDILAAPRDPRMAGKINSKYLHILLSKASMVYDVILIDTNHIIDEHKLVILDESDHILYIMTNDLVDIKNMKSMVSIYNDMGKSNYKIILNESKDKDGNYFSKNDIKNISGASVDYTIPAELYLKDLDRYILEGKILGTLSKFKSKHTKNFELICNSILGEEKLKKKKSNKINLKKKRK